MTRLIIGGALIAYGLLVLLVARWMRRPEPASSALPDVEIRLEVDDRATPAIRSISERLHDVGEGRQDGAP